MGFRQIFQLCVEGKPEIFRNAFQLVVEPDISLITSICIDHIDWLGETREAIGYEKAGIFRENVPAVVGDINPPDSLLKSAIEKNTPLLRINHDFHFQIKENNWEWCNDSYEPYMYLSLPAPILKGEHQYRNAASVLMAVTQMEKLLPVTEGSIHRGLQTVQLKGRFQLVKGDIPVFLDVAHNPQAVRMLLDYLVDEFSGKKIHAVFSMMKDKDINGVIEIINPVVHHWFITPLNTPRAASESYMQDCFRDCRLSNVSFGYKDFSEAYDAAKKNAEHGDLILIFGSFFLVSEYLEKSEV